MLKRILLLIVIAIVIVAISYGGKVKNWIIADQDAIQDTLIKETDRVNKNLIEVYQEISRNKIEIATLKLKVVEIEKEKIDIVVPANISDLVVAFNKYGFRARARSVLSH